MRPAKKFALESLELRELLAAAPWSAAADFTDQFERGTTAAECPVAVVSQPNAIVPDLDACAGRLTNGKVVFAETTHMAPDLDAHNADAVFAEAGKRFIAGPVRAILSAEIVLVGTIL